jgi:ABC-2 type transport system permease protein
MGRTARSVRALLSVALQTAANWRESFLMDFAGGALGSLGTVLPLVFVFRHANQVSGWTLPESLLVTAFFLVLQGLVGTLVEPNIAATVEAIRAGTFDHWVLKPIDSQVIASIQRIAPARIWDTFAGLLLMTYAFGQLPTPSLGDVSVAALMLLCGLSAMYGLFILTTASAFWWVRVDNLRHLLGSVLDAGRWPASVYRGWVRTLLSVVVPVTLVSTTPVEALLGRLDWSSAVHSILVSLAMLGLSRAVWRRALRAYTSASS